MTGANGVSEGIVSFFSYTIVSTTMRLGLESSSPHLFTHESKLFDDVRTTSSGRVEFVRARRPSLRKEQVGVVLRQVHEVTNGVPR